MPPLEPRVWPESGGAMGARIRAADWATTGLGVADGWPQCLKTTVEILLRAPVPMVLLWGAEGMLFVNDAFTALTDELPAPPGSPIQDDWSLAGLLDAGLVHDARAGTARSTPEQPVLLHRHGLAVPAWLTIAYTPVHDEHGNPAGVLVILSEAGQTAASAEPQPLQHISTLRLQDHSLQELYEQILAAALALMHADGGSLHWFAPAHQALQLLAWAGFDAESAAAWGHADAPGTWGQALRAGERVIVSDVELCEGMLGAADLARARRHGIRATQSTPLVSRGGHLVGILSTHWRAPHQPSARALQLLDMLARQAADLIERTTADEALRAAQAQTSLILESISDTFYAVDAQWRLTYLNRKAEQLWKRPREELLGTVLWEMFPGYEATVGYRMHLQAMRERTTVTWETFSPYLQIWVEASAYPSGDGLAVTFRDVSARKQAEEALRAVAQTHAYRVTLADALRPLADALEIQSMAARVLGTYLGASRVHYGEISADDTAVIIARDYSDGVRALSGQLRLDDFGPTLARALRAGQTMVQPDLGTSPERSATERAADAAMGIAAQVAVPLVKGGLLVALLAVHQRTPRAWTPAEVALIEETAELTWAAVERARAEAALRASEAKYRTLFDSIDAGFCIVQVLFDDHDRPVDYRFLEVNRAFERQTGIAAAAGRRMGEIAPQHEEHWFASYGAVARSGEAVRFTNRADHLHRVFDVYAFRIGDPAAHTVAVLFTDITARTQVEDALRQSEANFAKAFQSSPAALLITRLADGRYLELNDAYSAIVGYARDELLGHLTTEFNIYLNATDRQAIIDRLLTTGSIRAFETSIRHRSGAIRHVIADQEVMTFNGEACILTHFLDITERKRLEAALHTAFQRFQVILASLYGGILVMRDDDRVEFANQAFCDLFDLDEAPEALLGLHATDILQRIASIYVDSPAALARIQAIVAEGQPVRGEEITIAGARTYLRDFIPIVLEGNQYGRLWHHLDITALKQAEGALEAERALLAQRVAERTADLSIANAELVRAARVKDEFLSTMSHELRTPLNAILGRAELLREQIYGPLMPKQHTAVASIMEAGQHLLTLINDILDLSKVEAGKLTLELAPLEVEAVGHAAVRMVAQMAMSKRINLTSTYDSQVKTVVADTRRLKQILVNLLANAVKFTPAGGKVGLEIAADPGRQVVTFTVWDTGIGITPEDQARLFQPFVQVDSSLSRQHEGTGLGLALVLRLTELHGGSVTLVSSPGQGSRFSVALPWSEQAASPPGGPAPGRGAARAAPPAIRRAPRTEDSHPAVELLRDCLGALGSQVIVHGQASGAVERAAALQPDLIVLDILRPDQLGWAVLRRLKAAANTAAIPVLVVSAVGDPARAGSLGAAGFLRKPLTRPIFQEALQQLRATADPAGSPAIWQTLVVVAQDALPQPLVLIVDDNEANLQVLADFLPTAGFEVAAARNGAEAVTLAEERRPALIVMDLQMPVMDGLEAMRRIRAAGLRDTPIIALTALAMPGDRERCLEAGANVYLAKPVSPGTLLQLIAAQPQGAPPGE
ncbi:MAG: response regulator [Chloroflexales bacterium]|nr:response regulator [Chloroflexales bacterium]